MISVSNIHSLSDFQRNTKSYLRRLKRTGEPAVLTVNGEASVVVLDAGSFQRLLQRLDEADAVLGIRRGLESVAKGGGIPAQTAFARLDRTIDARRGK